MHLIPPNPPWSAALTHHDTVRLCTSNPLERRWYLLHLQMTGSSSSAAPRVKRGYDPTGSYLLPGARPGHWEIVFFHAQPLDALQLELPQQLLSESEEIQVQIAPISMPRAIARMMRTVSGDDREKGIDSNRIYRKSWARWRRKGWDGFLLRLVREYQPQEILSIAVQDPYRSWIDTVEIPGIPHPESNPTSFAALPSPPLFSVLLNTLDAPEGDVRRSIESILAQSYRHLELCIVPTSAQQKALSEYAAIDPRVRLIDPRSSSAALNSALAQAQGDYLALLHPGDVVSKQALFQVSQALGRTPGSRLLYTDEDSLDEKGHRLTPNFKPDWNPDLFLSQNYISDLCVLNRELVEAAGGFRLSQNDTAALYDLLLRALPHLRPEEIVHIPQVFYHRRAPKKEGVEQPGLPLPVLREHVQTLGREEVQVEEGLAPGLCRVRYPLPAPPPMVSLLIPTRDRRELVETCVRSILEKTTYPSFEILILDNQSQQHDTLDFFRAIQEEDDRVRVLPYDHPFNYSDINNFGVGHARGEVIGLINNDIEVITPDWLEEMASQALRPEIGCVGAKLYYPDDTLQHGGVILGLWGVAGHSHKHFPRSASGYFNRLLSVQNYSAVTAACLVVERHIYEEVGGLDEKHLPVSFNDVDFCLRVRRAGYRNLWTPYAELYHHESVSRGSDNTPEKKAREEREIRYMKATWGEALQNDPCYSPHLTHHMENFAINLDHILFPTIAEEQNHSAADYADSRRKNLTGS